VPVYFYFSAWLFVNTTHRRLKHVVTHRMAPYHARSECFTAPAPSIGAHCKGPLLRLVAKVSERDQRDLQRSSSNSSSSSSNNSDP